MKIGFVVSFFDFRNDVRRIITELSRSHNVVVFGSARDKESIIVHLPAYVEFRLINEEENSFRNRVWKRLFFFLRKIPKSRNNFFLMQLFHASNAPDENRKKALRSLRLLKFLPKVMSYDFLLDRLAYSGETTISDIDKFICFTDINNDSFIKRLLESQKSLLVYVYSWDHPFKHTKFSKRVNYLVWNNGLKSELSKMQGINPKRIQILGATQFTYIFDFLQKRECALRRHYDFPYIYFGCALGIEKLVPEELKIVQRLSKVLADVRPDVKLVVRPYPVLTNWSYYESLRSLNNIVLDDTFRQKDLSIQENHITEKYEKIHFAEAFFHIGTTMGLEACFTNTPSFILDLAENEENGLNLYNFIHQYQNEKFLIQASDTNVIRTENEFKEVICDLDSSKFLKLNYDVQKTFPLKSAGKIAIELVKY